AAAVTTVHSKGLRSGDAVYQVVDVMSGEVFLLAPLLTSRARRPWKRQHNITSGDDGGDVNANCVFHAPGGASGAGSDDRDVALACQLEGATIAFEQSLLGQRQAAELVFAERIGATNVEEHVGAKFIEGFLDGGHQGVKIFRVVGAIPHIDVDGRGRLV